MLIIDPQSPIDILHETENNELMILKNRKRGIFVPIEVILHYTGT